MATWVSQHPPKVNKGDLQFRISGRMKEQASPGRGVGLQARHPAMAITKRWLFREAVPGFVFCPGFTLLEVKGTTEYVVPSQRQPLLPIPHVAGGKGPCGDPRTAKTPFLSFSNSRSNFQPLWSPSLPPLGPSPIPHSGELGIRRDWRGERQKGDVNKAHYPGFNQRKGPREERRCDEQAFHPTACPFKPWTLSSQWTVNAPIASTAS